MPDKFQNKYRITSARLKNWDYGRNAAYFVTICTQNRECYFGHVEKTKKNAPSQVMILSEIGKIAQQYWYEIPKHFPFVKLGAFVVMPNHVHGIVIIDKPENQSGTENQIVSGNQSGTENQIVSGNQSGTVETLHATSLRSPPPTPSPPPGKNQKMASISPKPGSLSTIIRSYKSVITKNARKIHSDFAWQTRFHDRIIRNRKSYRTIAKYIVNNPLNWNDDKFYKR